VYMGTLHAPEQVEETASVNGYTMCIPCTDDPAFRTLLLEEGRRSMGAAFVLVCFMLSALIDIWGARGGKVAAQCFAS